VKAMQAELGEQRANALVRNALGDLYRQFGEQFRKAKQEKDLGKFVGSAFRTYARDGALDYDVVEQSEDAFAINVRGCRYAEFYKALGEPELGFLLVCTADFPTAEGFAATSNSRAPRPSCRARPIATSATGERVSRIEATE